MSQYLKKNRYIFKAEYHVTNWQLYALLDLCQRNITILVFSKKCIMETSEIIMETESNNYKGSLILRCKHWSYCPLLFTVTFWWFMILQGSRSSEYCIFLTWIELVRIVHSHRRAFNMSRFLYYYETVDLSNVTLLFDLTLDNGSN